MGGFDEIVSTRGVQRVLSVLSVLSVLVDDKF